MAEFERHFSKIIILGGISIIGSFLAGGCGCDNAIKAAVKAVDRARNEIREGRKEAVRAIDELRTSLPDEIRSTISVELDALSHRAIAAAGIEERCAVDHVNDRIDAALERLVARIKGEKPSAPTPKICSVYPTRIPYSHLAENRIYSVDVWGYDLQNDMGEIQAFELLLETPDEELPVTSHLSLSSTYQGVINLGSNGVPVDNRATALIIRHPGMSDKRIPFISLRPRIRRGRIPGAQQELRCTNLRVWGDDEFKGHGPCWFKFIAQLRHNSSSNQFETRIHMACVECKGNWQGDGDISWCRGWSPWEAQTAPLPHKVVNIITMTHQGPERDDEAFLTRPENRLQRNRCEHGCTTHMGDGGLVNRYDYWGDKGGDDDRIAHTRVVAYFNPIIYEYEEPIASLPEQDWNVLKKIESGAWPASDTVELETLRQLTEH